MQIIQNRKIFLSISIILMFGSLISLFVWGLNFGIDFTGGTLMELEFINERPSNQMIQDKLAIFELGQIVIQPVEQKGMILKTKDIDETVHQNILDEIGKDNIIEKRFESVGPVIGSELKRKSIWAIIFSLIAIVIFVAWAFRKVSKPVPSWQYGIAAIIALSHDILITCGLFAILGHWKGIEIGLPFIAALLTILGYSVNDTIVIFDRARDNLLRGSWDNFEDIVNLSVNQSIIRCLNTSTTTMFVLLAVFLLGGANIKYFALALMSGVVLGTYSSLFIASPLIVIWNNKKSKS
ncbi:protein translocase subunit SecF [Patescibacteria group bacterium]